MGTVLNTSAFSVAGQGVETEAGAEPFRSAVSTVVLKLEPASKSSR